MPTDTEILDWLEAHPDKIDVCMVIGLAGRRVAYRIYGRRYSPRYDTLREAVTALASCDDDDYDALIDRPETKEHDNAE